MAVAAADWRVQIRQRYRRDTVDTVDGDPVRHVDTPQRRAHRPVQRLPRNRRRPHHSVLRPASQDHLLERLRVRHVRQRCTQRPRIAEHIAVAGVLRRRYQWELDLRQHTSRRRSRRLHSRWPVAEAQQQQRKLMHAVRADQFVRPTVREQGAQPRIKSRAARRGHQLRGKRPGVPVQMPPSGTLSTPFVLA